MSTDEHNPVDHTTAELRAMDDDEARRTLTVAEYERREKLLDLYEQAEETRERFADEDERVTDIAVHSDPHALGTEFYLYGNDILLHFSSDDDRIQALQERIDDHMDDVDDDADEELDRETIEAVTGDMIDLLDIMLLEWNGHDWGDLPEDKRRAVLEQARQDWGIESMYLGIVEAATAVREDREERVEVVESFRGETRRGNR